MILVLKLNRRIYSKKNSKRVMIRGGKFFITPSAAFEKFNQEAKADIYEQLHRIPARPLFNGPVKIHTDLFIPGKTIVDGDNLHTSLLDVLMGAKIIADDMWVLEGSYKKHPGAGGWGATIVIEDL